MLFYRSLAIASLFLGGCQSAPVTEPPADALDQTWHESTLSAETIAKANAAVADYRHCLSQETAAKNQDRGDPRTITNAILKACEDWLPAIKTAYDAEHVPVVISERYIRKTRSQGVQSVLRYVSAIQAQRAGDEQEAQDKAKQPASKPKQTKATP
jgi:uncharacterized protein (DUF2267 family)